MLNWVEVYLNGIYPTKENCISKFNIMALSITPDHSDWEERPNSKLGMNKEDKGH